MALRIGLAQFDPSVGAFEANLEAMGKIYAQALQADVDLLVFGEMALCGYPPEDLLLKKHFLDDNHQAIEKLAADCAKIILITGFAETCNEKCCNAVAVLRNGRIEKTYRKCKLPNYGVFDEQRYFSPGAEPAALEINNVRIGLTICEDIWQPDWLADFLKPLGAVDLLVNVAASPFHLGKIKLRQQILSDCAKKINCPVAYCNLIGGQDELVFDGQSMFTDTAGKVIAQADAFTEDLLIADVNRSADGVVKVKPVSRTVPMPTDILEEIYQALVLGVRDYVRKNKFSKALIGLSGGVDSSLTAAIAAAALGAENVIAVTMPSRFNSPETISDAKRQAENLGIELLTIPIGPLLEKFNQTLNAVPGWDSAGVAYENLQARIRGSLLMTLSNQFGHLVLTTGNKSETAVGYTTLYGDTAGGFAVIKDVPKTMVYKLAEYINRLNKKQVIPKSVIKRAPSAELRPGQQDTDSLPDYDLLDKILTGYVEQDKSAQQLVDQNLPADIVNRVIRMVDRNEYKRRQSPPGIKITPKAFGKDRRLPITNCYTTQA